MKKLIAGFVFTKLALLAIFAALIISSGQTANLSPDKTPATPTPASNANVSSDEITRPTSEPYTGDLSIFEDENRAKNLQIDRVMDILKIVEGRTVADLGAGSGWFTVRAAKRVGDKGKVFAVEINQEYISHINERAKRDNYANITTVLGTEDNPNLADKSIDAVLILKTYHEIGKPVTVMKNLRKALRKDALVGIIDRNGTGDDHGIDKEKVIEEAKRAGFVLKEEYDFVKEDAMDYFLVFKAAK
jgi:SAM-dependent methyltransferase